LWLCHLSGEKIVVNVVIPTKYVYIPQSFFHALTVSCSKKVALDKRKGLVGGSSKGVMSSKRKW